MSEQNQKTQKAITGEGSVLKKYQAVMVGSTSLLATLYFEICAWLAVLPGAVGLLLRKVFWPRLFNSCGSGVQFGRGITLRHPGRIDLGDNVVVSEACILDARNVEAEQVISIGSDVMLANGVSISAKGGTISIGAKTGIGAQTVIQSTNACSTTIGEKCIIGPACYLVGGGTYNIDDLDTPIMEQGVKPDSGCHLSDNVWLGGHVTVLGDVTMGEGSIAAAGAVVNKNVKALQIVGGVPAKLIKTRT